MQFEIKVFENGSVSLLDHQFGETMHSLIGPEMESQAIYLQQSNLLDRLLMDSPDPLVVFDVGLGMGSNALACLELWKKISPARSMHIVSFENNLAGLKFAIDHSSSFPQIVPNLRTLHQLVEKKEVIFENGRDLECRWSLLLGDFRVQLRSAPAPEIIFYDFYSSKACPDLWNFEIFHSLHQSALRCKNSTLLCTYSTATSARTALILAGFYVGRGVSTAGKRETTVASTRKSDLCTPLDGEWLEHWKRSSKPLPPDIAENEKVRIQKELQLRLTGLFENPPN